MVRSIELHLKYGWRKHESRISNERNTWGKLFYPRNKAMWINKKYKKVYKALNCIELLRILASTVTGCVSISAFASIVAIPTGVASSTVGINFVQ